MRLPLSRLTLLLGLGLLPSAAAADLSGVKTYLGGKLDTQLAGTRALSAAADGYYALAKSANFDYKVLAKNPQTRTALQAARAGWSKASPAYEDIEGIVAGVEALSAFDVILDAGTSAADGGEDVVPFDLKLPNGKTLAKPGNLFGVNEGTLWGTVGAYSSGVAFDVNGNGKMDFGDQLPDANVLKTAAAELNRQSLELQKAANAWKPSREDVFGALVGNVPTVGPVFFEDWKSSPFVIGSKSVRKDFVVISRMSDLSGNVSSWRAMYRGLSPDVKAKNAALDTQIQSGLNELALYVGKLVGREQSRRYTPEQAEQLQREAQNRATVITGRITQAAALLGVEVE
ncbi:imelysin family protein [Deinococcus arenicola]|uniref:EfeM/EfeO family lipoprotein n=1 Tax=Deinococcus arenicola TaxID=2994950 RepID=A0ABU4DLX8_9DEIO|nr:imelysin family protein [Deinococcus sp. ZS9-10]MDV6373449.1 EfeM/EfeO family lipoprotein [Deinococcus sp. ZS9-10]